MLPFGLQFQSFKSPKKLPMRLEESCIEDLKKHIYKIANVECPKDENIPKRKNKNKNKTKKTPIVS